MSNRNDEVLRDETDQTGRNLLVETVPLSDHLIHQREPSPHLWRPSMRRTVVFAIICMISLAFLALLATQILTPAQETTQRTVQSPLLGHKAPDFTLPVLSGSSASTFHLATLKGRPLILNFWASWCDACKEEAPLLQRTWQQIAPQGAVMIGIDFEDTSEAGK